MSFVRLQSRIAWIVQEMGRHVLVVQSDFSLMLIHVQRVLPQSLIVLNVQEMGRHVLLVAQDSSLMQIPVVLVLL